MGTSDDDAAEPLAFDAVYERYRERVYAFCLLQVRNPALAEDLTEDAFFAAYRAYDKARPDPEGVHVWLFRIARNLVSDHWRRERRRSRILQIVGRNTGDSADVENVAAINAELLDVINAIAKMKPADRQVISLRIGAEMSNREIAQMLNIPENTAASAVRRALERFRREHEGSE